MNKVLCDKCQEQIKVEINIKYKSGRIEIQFLRCNHCGDKALISVTDRQTREKQRELRKWAEQRNKALDINVDGMSEEKLKELTAILDETMFNINRLQEEIKKDMAELREKYKGEL